MTDMNKLSPAALRVAMRAGTDGWGEWGSADEHQLYAEPISGDRRRLRKCHCGCDGKADYGVKANGLALCEGCEWLAKRAARDFNGTMIWLMARHRLARSSRSRIKP